MIELHCHILPEVDDGARNLKESLKMLRLMAQDGVTHVVATPHCTRTLRHFRDFIIPRVDELNEAVLEKHIPIKVFPGSEISFYDAEEYRANYEAGIFCHYGGGSEYTLVEFPWSSLDVPDNPLQHIDWLLEQGTTPILAHPERTPFLRENPELLKAMHEAGAWIQLTSDSVTGVNGGLAQLMSEAVLRTFPNVVLATDSHNTMRRSNLSEGYRAVAAKFGVPRADDLLARADLVRQSIENVST